MIAPVLYPDLSQPCVDELYGYMECWTDHVRLGFLEFLQSCLNKDIEVR